MKIRLLLSMMMIPCAINAMQAPVPGDAAPNPDETAVTIPQESNNNSNNAAKLDAAANVLNAVEGAVANANNNLANDGAQEALLAKLQSIEGKLASLEPWAETQLTQHGWTAKSIKIAKLAALGVITGLNLGIGIYLWVTNH